MRSKHLRKVSLAALAVAIVAPQALAQSSGDDDLIIVTGSFIKKKSQLNLPSPLQTVAAADIEDIGAQNIGDITQTLTINTGAQNNPDAFTQNSTTGTSSINLRGLGLGSTLVLLNGKRQVTTATTTNDGISFVDTSSLVPMIAIKRLEILKDGASALYGTDAVAGVANFITRDDYEGFALSGDWTNHSSQGNYNEYSIQAMAGKNFDRGNIMIAASYLDRSPLTTLERRLSRAVDDSSALGNPGSFFGVPGFPAAAPVIDPTGCEQFGGIPQIISATPAGIPDVGLCRFDFGDFFNLVPEEERLTVYAQGSYELSDSVTWKAEFSYADNSAIRGNSPTFPFLQSALVPSTNPNNIFGSTVLFFGRAIGNGGAVSPNNIDSETWRASTSLTGDLDNGAWELSFTHAENDYLVATEDTITDRFQCALAGFDPAVGAALGLDCASVAGQAGFPGVGTFYNPFATSFTTSPNDQSVLDFIIGTQVRDLQAEMTVIEGFISNELFQLPSGPVSIAVGGQYRDNKLTADFDAISRADNFGFLIGEQPYTGSIDVIGAFAELAIPVSDIIEVQLALRHERYGSSEGGSTTDPKIAVLIRPNDMLALRGSFSTSFRAPSVFQQLGQGTSLNQVSDPVTGGTAFAAVRTFGDPTLKPEESEAFNLGGTFAPLDGLEFNFDYFDFDFKNVIIPENFQAIVNADPTGPNVIRSPAGTIVQINANFVNAASLKTSGVDFSVKWAIDTEMGTITPSIEGTYLDSYSLEDPLAGTISGAGNRNFANFGTSAPKWRVNGGLKWAKGAHSANVYIRHINSYSDDQNGGISIKSDTRVDVQYSVKVNEFLGSDKLAAITIGARNVTNETPPQVFTNGGFDSKVHDPRGRLLYIGVDLEL